MRSGRVLRVHTTANLQRVGSARRVLRTAVARGGIIS